MNYGYFDNKNREYVIEHPDTPAPWVNYLGSPSTAVLHTEQSSPITPEATALPVQGQTAGYCAMYSITLTSLGVISIFMTRTRKITGLLPGSRWEKISPSTKASAAMVLAIRG